MTKVEFHNWCAITLASARQADLADRSHADLAKYDPRLRELCDQHTAKFREIITYIEAKTEIKR